MITEAFEKLAGSRINEVVLLGPAAYGGYVAMYKLQRDPLAQLRRCLEFADAASVSVDELMEAVNSLKTRVYAARAFVGATIAVADLAGALRVAGAEHDQLHQFVDLMRAHHDRAVCAGLATLVDAPPLAEPPSHNKLRAVAVEVVDECRVLWLVAEAARRVTDSMSIAVSSATSLLLEFRLSAAPEDETRAAMELKDAAVKAQALHGELNDACREFAQQVETRRTLAKLRLPLSPEF